MRPAFLRVLIYVVWILIIGLVWLALTQRPVPEQTVTTRIIPLETPTPAVEIPIPTPAPSPEQTTVTSNFVGQVQLIIPVAGVRPDQLIDTFDQSRSEGRVHDAIDIMAPAGTPVLAATDGKILKLFQSERGGTTIYQLSYVGDTGNAGAGNYHLHFSISAVSDPKRYWEGTNINPYPLLRSTVR
jgi:murein DD-endopeptidase MepM/ murein hydrolase activator NlpD